MGDDNDNVNPYAGGGDEYDPDAPVPYWHQRMELITICVANSLTLLIIIARVVLRRIYLKRFRADDLWVAAAGIVLIFPHWVCQIGTNRYGSGLHAHNIPDEWLVPYWTFSWGWCGYFIVVSLIKVSVCCCLLEILPHTFFTLRALVYLLCFFALGLGVAEALVWLFQCQPFMSNFHYSVEPLWCVNIEMARYMWVAISVLIDAGLVLIPFVIISRVRIKSYERKALLLVFGASLLGTFTCLVGIYGIWYNRNKASFQDQSYTDSIFVMVNDIEILMYTIGASATVLSKFFVSRAANMTSRRGSATSSPRPDVTLSGRSATSRYGPRVFGAIYSPFRFNKDSFQPVPLSESNYAQKSTSDGLSPIDTLSGSMEPPKSWNAVSV